MLVLCPACERSNPVVDDYKPGSILACDCGAHLEFIRAGVPPNVIPKGAALYSANAQKPKQKVEAS